MCLYHVVLSHLSLSEEELTRQILSGVLSYLACVAEGEGVSPMRAPVLSFTHYFQAPVTQAISY